MGFGLDVVEIGLANIRWLCSGKYLLTARFGCRSGANKANVTGAASLSRLHWTPRRRSVHVSEVSGAASVRPVVRKVFENCFSLPSVCHGFRQLGI